MNVPADPLVTLVKDAGIPIAAQTYLKILLEECMVPCTNQNNGNIVNWSMTILKNLTLGQVKTLLEGIPPAFWTGIFDTVFYRVNKHSFLITCFSLDPLLFPSGKAIVVPPAQAVVPPIVVTQQGDNVVKVTTQRNNINDVTATMARINGIPDETMERISTAAFSSVVGGDVNNINPDISNQDALTQIIAEMGLLPGPQNQEALKRLSELGKLISHQTKQRQWVINNSYQLWRIHAHILGIQQHIIHKCIHSAIKTFVDMEANNHNIVMPSLPSDVRSVTFLLYRSMVFCALFTKTKDKTEALLKALDSVCSDEKRRFQSLNQRHNIYCPQHEKMGTHDLATCKKYIVNDNNNNYNRNNRNNRNNNNHNNNNNRNNKRGGYGGNSSSSSNGGNNGRGAKNARTEK